MIVEILIIIGVAVAAFFAIRYIVREHKRHGCVGCSMAKQCGHNWEKCPKTKQDPLGKK